MWGNKESKQKQRSGGHTTLIASGTEISGDIRFSGHLEIEGIVRGNISATNDEGDAFVRVLQSGRIEGEVRAPEVVINGRVNGDVYAAKHVELAEQAVVDGDVHYNLIEMIKGAQVNGNLVHITGPVSTPLSSLPVADFDDDEGAGDITDSVGSVRVSS